jgi:hypothetical protein
VSGKKVLGGGWVFGSEREELTGHWRRLHDKKLRDVYWSPSVMWVIKSETVMAGACGTESFDKET